MTELTNRIIALKQKKNLLYILLKTILLYQVHLLKKILRWEYTKM